MSSAEFIAELQAAKERKAAEANQKNAAREKEQMELMGEVQRAEQIEREYGNQSRRAQGRQAFGYDWGDVEEQKKRQLEARQDQEWLQNKYKEAIEGRGPSVAQQQMYAGRDANIAQARAMAASTRGGIGAQAAAQRQAMMTGAAATQATVQQAGILRAQEQQAAMAGAADLAAQQRAADLQAQGYSMQQAQAIVENEARNRQQNDAYQLALMGGAAGMHESQMQMRQGLYQAGLGYEQNMENIKAQERAANRQRNAQMLSAGIGSAATLGAAAMMFSDVRAKTGIQPIDPNSLEYATSQPLSAYDQQQQPQMTRAEKLAIAQNIGGAAGNFGGAYFSDVRAKKLIEPAPDREDLREFLREAEPYRYEYRDPERHGHGERFGPMAQDLEQTRVGRTLVRETPEGKAIEGPAAMSALLASQHELQQQIDELRYSRGGRR